MDPLNNAGSSGQTQSQPEADTASFRQAEREPLAPVLQSLAPQQADTLSAPAPALAPPAPVTPVAAAAPDYDQPVAYDRNGAPLYAHPPTPQAAAPVMSPAPAMQPAGSQVPVPTSTAAPQILSRNTETPADLQQKHDESAKKYPTLSLSPGEYVLAEIKRDGVGLAQIWATGVVLFIAMFLFIPLMTGKKVTLTTRISVIVVMVVLTVLIALGVMVASRVYRRNKVYLTNESVIQEAHASLFSKDEQVVGLDSVKDVTFSQHGMLASIFNFGTVKLFLEGHETDYQFAHVANPKQQCALINNTVEDFKRSHP